MNYRIQLRQVAGVFHRADVAVAFVASVAAIVAIVSCAILAVVPFAFDKPPASTFEAHPHLWRQVVLLPALALIGLLLSALAAFRSLRRVVLGAFLLIGVVWFIDLTALLHTLS